MPIYNWVAETKKGKVIKGELEATDEKEEMYSDEKLVKIFKQLGHLSPEEIKEGILESLQGYNCKDDVTIMILKREE